MIAPSPDWVVGVSGVSLRNAADDGWQPFLTVDLFPYDAGTEEGTKFSLVEPRDLAAGNHHEPPGDGQVLERADRDPDLHSPVCGAGDHQCDDLPLSMRGRQRWRP